MAQFKAAAEWLEAQDFNYLEFLHCSCMVLHSKKPSSALQIVRWFPLENVRKLFSNLSSDTCLICFSVDCSRTIIENWTDDSPIVCSRILQGAFLVLKFQILSQLDRVKRIWYLSPMRAAKVQASLRIRAVSPEPSLLAHTSSESRGTFRQKARSLAPLNGWTSAVKICHDGMLEDTNSLDGAHLIMLTFLMRFAT